MSTSRLASFLLATAIVLCGPRALAQGTGGASGSTTFGASDFSIYLQDPPPTGTTGNGTNIADIDLATSTRGFNLARCQCQTPYNIRVILSDSGRAKKASITSSMFVKVAVGSLCDASPGYINNAGCRQIGESSYLMTTLGNFGINVPTTATEFVTLGNDPAACTTKDSTGSVTIYVLLYSSASGTVQDAAATRSVVIDVQPPATPTILEPQGGQEALNVRWSGLDQTAVNDLVGYQVFCIRGGQYQVFRNSGGALSAFDELKYLSPRMLNGGSCTRTARDPDSVVTRADVEALDPAIACSSNLSVNNSSYRIQGLENGVPYQVAVAAVDKYGNASPIVDRFAQGVPVETRDFWQGYRRASAGDDDAATGGFCALGGDLGGAGSAAVVAGVMLLIAGRRRRR